MSRFEFENVCKQMGLSVVEEFEDINAITLRHNGVNIADIYLDEYGYFTTCFSEFKKLDDKLKKQIVFLLAEFSTRDAA